MSPSHRARGIAAASAPPSRPATRPDVSDDRPEILTAAEAAALLRVKLSWVGDATRRGVLPSLKFGRLVRYSRVDLEGWMAAQRQPLRQPLKPS